MSSVWVSLMIFWVPRGLAVIHSIAYVAGSGCLHCTGTAALAWHQMIFTSPKSWALYCNWSAHPPTASPGLSSRTLTLPHGIKPEDTASPIAVQSTKSQQLSTPLHAFKTTLVTLTITKSSLDTLATSISVG